jgi:hypothetical protein
MNRSSMRGLFALIATAICALALGASPAGSDVGLQNVTLACNDGTNLVLALDAAEMTKLSGAVAAIGLYPAGDPPLSCSLTQSTATSSSSSGANGPHDFVVGGGQFLTSCGLENFSISAHVADDAPAAPGQQGIGGTYNLSTGATSSCGQGHLTSKIDCLQVPILGFLAQWTSKITHATGFRSGSAGHELGARARDSAPDELSRDGGDSTSGTCSFGGALTTPIARGNIDIHDA